MVKMRAPTLNRRSLSISTSTDLDFTPNDATRRFQVRDDGADIGGKAVVTATTVTTMMTHMTMMIYETQRPSVAGRVGPDDAAVPPTSTGPPAIPPTGILTAPPMTAMNASSLLPGQIQPANTGLSTGTSHLLIAAGAVGATILITFIIFLIYRVRNGKPLREIFRSFRSRQSSHSLKPIRNLEKEASVSAPLGSNWEAYNWEKNKTWDAETSFAASSLSVNQPQYYRPEPAFMRPGTSSSGRPLLAASPSRAPFPPPNLRSSSVPPNMPLPPDPPAKSRLASAVPSSSFMPVERGRPRSQSASDTRSSSDTFPAYLTNIVNNEADSPPKVSRFSWTNSQAPKTPLESRFSVASSIQSVPRYRTVESWVGQQTKSLEEQKMQDNLRQQIELAIKEVKDATSNARSRMATSPPLPLPPTPSPPRMNSLPLPVEKDASPPVPDVPMQFRAIPEDEEMEDIPPQVPRKSYDLDRGKQKMRHVTQGSDATIFQVHPGTKVRIPSETYIPSVILDDTVATKIDAFKRRSSFEGP